MLRDGKGPTGSPSVLEATDKRLLGEAEENWDGDEK